MKRGRWVETIFFRPCSYNRHELYLFRRKVPFWNDTDVHSALRAWNLKAFSSFFLSLFWLTDVLWPAKDFSSSSSTGSNSTAEKGFPSRRSSDFWAHKDGSFSLLKRSTFYTFLLPLGRSLLLSQSPWLVSWHLPFSWFSRLMLPPLSWSRQDLTSYWTPWTLMLDNQPMSL